MSPLFPWPTFSEPWTLQVHDVLLDGVPAADAIDAEHHRITLSHDDWDVATLDVSLRTGEPKPIDVHVAGVLVDAAASNFRPFYALGGGNDERRGWIDLERDLLWGVVRVHGEAASLIDGRARTVAHSNCWTIVVDAGAAPVAPGAAPLQFSWISFSADDAPDVARRHAGAHVVVEVDPEPRAYLNRDVEGLQALLNDTTAQGERRHTRDLVGIEIARTITTALVRHGIRQMFAVEDDVLDLPDDPVLRSALERAAVGLAITPEELCERVRLSADDVKQHAALWTDLDAAIATMTDYTEAVRGAVGRL